MNFQLIGVNHVSAPIEVRERLVVPESEVPNALRKLSQHPGVEEAMILSTCNRVEILTRTSNGAVNLRAFLQEYVPINHAEDDEHR
jgi:glutamyl-tRNA reductase